MRTITSYPAVDQDKCVGCEFCVRICPYDVMQVENHKAFIDQDKCMSCLGCFDICPHGAIILTPLFVPKEIKYENPDIPRSEVEALCAKAQLVPDRPICTCTLTSAAECATAILAGAKTLQDVARMTGANSDCGVWCTGPIVRLLVAAGVDVDYTTDGITKGTGVYPCDVHLTKVSDEVAEKYPQYRIKDDREHIKRNEVPFLPEML